MTTAPFAFPPVVEIQSQFFAGQESTVHVMFSLRTLERIEIAMEMSVGELMMKLAEMAGRTADGQIDARAAMKAFSVRTAARFVGACLDWPPERVADQIPPGSLLVVFRDLCSGFSQAASQLYGVGEEPEANPHAPAGGAG